MVNGYQDHPLAHSHQVYLGQHNLALDLDYDEYGHPDYQDHNQEEDHDYYGHVLHVGHHVVLVL